jgi:hypothetical protein
MLRRELNHSNLIYGCSTNTTDDGERGHTRRIDDTQTTIVIRYYIFNEKKWICHVIEVLLPVDRLYSSSATEKSGPIREI